jgi:hypothetical protein
MIRYLLLLVVVGVLVLLPASSRAVDLKPAAPYSDLAVRRVDFASEKIGDPVLPQQQGSERSRAMYNWLKEVYAEAGYSWDKSVVKYLDDRKIDPNINARPTGPLLVSFLMQYQESPANLKWMPKDTFNALHEVVVEQQKVERESRAATEAEKQGRLKRVTGHYEDKEGTGYADVELLSENSVKFTVRDGTLTFRNNSRGSCVLENKTANLSYTGYIFRAAFDDPSPCKFTLEFTQNGSLKLVPDGECRLCGRNAVLLNMDFVKSEKNAYYKGERGQEGASVAGPGPAVGSDKPQSPVNQDAVSGAVNTLKTLKGLFGQ